MHQQLRRWQPRLWHLRLICVLSWMGGLLGCDLSNTSPPPPTAESSTLVSENDPQQRLRQAKQKIRSGQTAEAILLLQSILVTAPEDEEAVFLLAQCEINQGRQARALELLLAIEPSRTKTFEAASWLAADLLTKQQRADEAVVCLETLCSVQPSVKLHRLLAMLLNQLGRRREAGLHLYELARAGDISEEELFQMNSFSQPIIGHGGIHFDPTAPLTSDLLNEAKRERIEGDLGKSSELVRQLMAAFPHSAAISAFYGQTLADLEDYTTLAEWLNSLPAGVELESEYWYALGKWMSHLEQGDQAVRCYLENILIDPTDRNAYRELSNVLSALGHFQEAKNVTKRYEQLQEVYLLTAKLGKEPGTLEQVDRLAAKLDQLNRPFEAIGWRKAGANGRGRGRSELIALEEHRLQLIQQNHPPDIEFKTCGLRILDWPSPRLEHAATPIARSASELRENSETHLRFEDIADQIGLDFYYQNGDQQGDSSWYIYQISGGGIGVVDFDLDGWQDLYFGQAGKTPWTTQCEPNSLYRNLGGRKMLSVTSPSATGDQSYSQGVAVADLNQDGFQDLMVANIGVNQIYFNNGDGTFKQIPVPTSTVEGDWTTSIACGDLSGDGLPEMVEVNYIDDRTAYKKICEANNQNCNPLNYRAAISRTWSMRPSGDLEPWDGCKGMREQRAYGFAAIITNLDGAPGNELIVINDNVENYLWRAVEQSEHDARTLDECAQLAGCAVGWLGQRQGSMGIALGDFDRDSRPDLHVTNYWNQPADLFLQKSNGVFTNATAGYRLYEPSRLTVGWGTQAVDFDRDGWLDLAVLNGHVLDRRHENIPLEMKPQLFQGAKGRFDLVSDDKAAGEYWTLPAQGRTLATLDWNRDGLPDLVANHLDKPAALLENRSQTSESTHWLQIELVGTVSERDATGAVVKVKCQDFQVTQWVAGGDGFACSNENVLDYGLASAQTIDEVEVLWPSGLQQKLTGLEINHRYLVIENEVAPYVRDKTH